MLEGWFSPHDWCTKLLNAQFPIIDYLTDPCILPVKLTGPRYLQFLRAHLHLFLEDISLRTRKRIWFCTWCSSTFQSGYMGVVKQALSRTFDRSWPESSRIVATTVTEPQSDKLLLVGYHEKCCSRQHCWHQKETSATHLGCSKRDSYHKWDVRKRHSLFPTSCWHMCSYPRRAFQTFG
jgi:hypothetical protein